MSSTKLKLKQGLKIKKTKKYKVCVVAKVQFQAIQKIKAH